MLHTLLDTFSPFLWGGALALVLNRPMVWLETKLFRLGPRLRRAAALTLTLLGLAAAVGLGIWLLIPQLLAAAGDLAAALPRLRQTLDDLLARAGTSGAAAARFAGQLRGDAAPLWQAGMTAAKSAAGALGQIFLSLVLAVYLLAGKEAVLRKARQLCCAALGPGHTRRLAAFARQAAAVFAGFITGQCIEACILAGLFLLVFLVFGIPYALPLSAVIGVTALVPVFGAWAGCLVGLVLLLPVSLEKAGWFLVLFVAVQQFEGNLIYPRVVGGRLGLPPLLVLAAVLVGGRLFGMAGLVLGLPAASVLYHVGGQWVRARLAAQRR